MTTEINIFEQATRVALRFASNKGDLTTEQLWGLPLQSKSGFDLDTVAKTANAALKQVDEESFVETRQNPAKAELKLKLDIVKHIIAVRLAENEAARTAADRKAKKDRLLEILAKKDDAALEGMSREDLTKQIAELG